MRILSYLGSETRGPKARVVRKKTCKTRPLGRARPNYCAVSTLLRCYHNPQANMLYQGPLLALLLASCQCALGNPTPLDDREADAEPSPVLEARQVTINTFDYVPTNGPLTWHKTAASPQCKDGIHQSPVMLDSHIGQTSIGALSFTGTDSVGKLEHRGTAIEVVGVRGSLRYAGHTYHLENLHFHTPSEHRIHKEHYPIEMHMVHQDSTGKTVVLGFVIQLSTSGYSALPQVALAKVGQITPGRSILTNTLHFGGISNYVQNNRFYHYSGSLTTPPCKQGVEWLVGTQPLHLDVHTYNALKHAVKYNSRIIQNAPGQTNVLKLACS